MAAPRPPTADCVLCGRPAPLFFETGDHNRRLSAELFAYYRCACGTIFQRPVPADLSRYYPDEYYVLPATLAELNTRAEVLQRWKIDLVQRFAPPGRLMEIGPAYGLFAHLAARAGFDVETIEMDQRCCQYLTDVVGVKATNSSDASSVLQRSEPFDVIALWQVLEHLGNPLETLASCADRLTPGGVVVLDTPNPGAWQLKLLGRFWTHIDAPRHLQLIPARVLVEQLKPLGLRPVWLSARDQSAIGFNSFGWAYSLRNFFSNEPTRTGAFLLGRMINKLMIPIERTGWRGSTYTAVFRKV